MLTRTGFWAQAQELHLVTPGDTIVVGVSAGVDSMTLLDLLRHAPAALHLAVRVVYVDHQLRPESAAEADFVRTFCAAHQLPLDAVTWHHPPLDHGVEEAARTFRYRAFAAALRHFSAHTLWLAHHNDDALETVVMKLARSGSVFEQPGLQLVSDRPGYTLVRPLLPYPKTAIRAYADRHRVPHYEDASNQDPRYQRNQVRTAVVPAVRALNTQSAAHVLRYTEEMTAAKELLRERLAQLAAAMTTRQGTETLIARPAFNALPRGQRSLLLQYLAGPAAPLTGRQLTQCLALAESRRASGAVQLAGGWQCRISYDEIRLTRENQSQDGGIFLPVRLSLLSTVFYPDGHWWHLAPAGPGLAVPAGVVLRHRRPGDMIQLPSGQHQALRRFFINQKIPRDQRETLVLAAVGDQVWCIPGYYQRQLSGMAQPDTMKGMLTYR